MPIRSFLDLDVYQRGYQTALVVNREIVPKLPDSEKYDLKDQLRRASKAIPALIAEGYARKHHKKDWQKYIDDSIGEANEMIVHLSLARDLYPKFIDTKLCEELIKEYDIIGKQLFRLGKSWNKYPPHPSFSQPDSPPNSHPHILLAVGNLALTIGGTPIPTIPEKIPTGGIFTGPQNLQKILQVSFSILIIAAILLAIFFILFSGIQWITSGGDKQKLQAARNRLTFAIIGLLIVFLAVMIVSLISFVFNVRLIGGLVFFPGWGFW